MNYFALVESRPLSFDLFRFYFISSALRISDIEKSHTAMKAALFPSISLIPSPLRGLT